MVDWLGWGFRYNSADELLGCKFIETEQNTAEWRHDFDTIVEPCLNRQRCVFHSVDGSKIRLTTWDGAKTS